MDKKLSTAIQALKENPFYSQTDKGSEFKAKLVKSFLSDNDIKFCE